MRHRKNHWDNEKIKLLNEAVKNSHSWTEVARKMNDTKTSVKYAGKLYLNRNDFKKLREFDATKGGTRFKDDELESLRSCIRSSVTMEEVHQKMNSMGFQRSLRALSYARIKFLPNSFLIGEDADEFNKSEISKGSSKKVKNQKSTTSSSYGPLFERSVQTTVPVTPADPSLKDLSGIHPPDIQDKVDTLESLVKKIYQDGYRRGYEDGSSSTESKMIEKILRIYKKT